MEHHRKPSFEMENGVPNPQSELSNAITNACGLAIFQNQSRQKTLPIRVWNVV